MNKASKRSNFFKQRLNKLAKKSATSRPASTAVTDPSLAVSQSASLATAATSSSRSTKRSIPPDALAEDLIVSDARGNPRRSPSDKKSTDRPVISEMVREATAGGVIYRLNQQGQLEILLVADHFDRWTIPKGHIEDGETAQETAIREIGEEAGVHELQPMCWLGKIHFRYRRGNTLVLMSTQIYLFKALGDTNKIQKEDWMNGIKWFSFDEAVEIIAYEDIAKLMLLGRNRLRQRGEINDQD
jgi:diadenosine hexaphosphate hydrolase (ATP-forming)